MALRKLTLNKKRSQKMAELREKKKHLKQLRNDEQRLTQEIDAADEVDAELESRVEELEQDREETQAAIDELTQEIADIDAELESLGGDDGDSGVDGGDDTGDDSGNQRSAARSHQRRAVTTPVSSRNYRSRSRCFTSRADCEAFYQRSEVKSFLQRVREYGGQKRGVTGAELNIPTVMLELLRDNLGERSKLINRVRLRSVRGQARQNIIGKVPEGVWTEMCASLNELEFQFTQIEVDGFKVGGFIAICNAVLEDSDVNLGEEIMDALLRAIGVAVDKAIVYGLGATRKMPLGFVTRLAQTQQPDTWNGKMGTWTDLHTSNILKLNLAATSGVEFFQPLLMAMAKAKPEYSNGSRTTWIMNHTTHMDLISRGLTFNSAGALVAGLNGAMPVENGDIVELDFMPDYEFAGGYLDLYLMAEREGASVQRSEHVRFLEDQTVFKGTARYDGQPIIADAFAVVNYNNVDPTTAISFAEDYANQPLNVLIATSAAGTSSGDTVVTVAGKKSASNSLAYKAAATNENIKVGMKVQDYEEFVSGTTQITAATGTPISIVELDSKKRVVSAGAVTAVART